MKPNVAREPGVILKYVKLIIRALSARSQLNDSKDEEQNDQVRLMRIHLTQIVRLRKERQVVCQAAKAVKPKPRRGPPKQVLNKTTEYSDDNRVKAAPTRKSRAGRERRRPAHYL